MRIKKYEGKTEQEAIEKVKNELGLGALVLNIKKTQPRGLFAPFRKPLVEVTAAYDDKPKEKSDYKSAEERYQITKPVQESTPAAFDKKPSVVPNETAKTFESIAKDSTISKQQDKIKILEKKLESAEDLLENVVSQLTIAKQSNFGNRKYENSLIQLFYDTLIEQGVTSEISERLLEDVNSIDDDDKIDVNLIVKIVYNTIINTLGEPETVDFSKIEKGKPRKIVFLGPTGVGKTTTIAKLSSIFFLNSNLKVGLITADTYRIAAVEQLKTYAEILGIDVGVVYNSEDLLSTLESMKNFNDVILIDTAGRSHKNHENLKELEQLLDSIQDSEKYLVLSTTTKYEDLLNIVGTYSSITDFRLIFTKLDETTCLGSILNICSITGRKISYVTYGQNVPEDIEIIQPEKIAKALLGLGGGLF